MNIKSLKLNNFFFPLEFNVLLKKSEEQQGNLSIEFY